MRTEYSLPARLLGIGLPLTIVAGTIAGAVVLHSVTLAEAAVLAIVLAPTDAALGQAVVTDPALPSRIRQGLNVESGLNDGLCVPLLAIALAVATTDAGETTSSNVTKLVVEAIGWGVVGGVVAGVIVGYALVFARRRGWIEGQWIQIVPVIAAVGAFAIADARGGSGFIAAFVGGVVFGRISGQDAEAAAFSEELGSVLNGVTLIVFGAAVLGAAWSRIGIVEVFYAVLSLTVVRMIPVAISLLGSHACHTHDVVRRLVRPPRPRVDRVRRGCHRRRGSPAHSEIVIGSTVTVALSVLAHGVTAAPLARRYAAWHAVTGVADGKRARTGSAVAAQPTGTGIGVVRRLATVARVEACSYVCLRIGNRVGVPGFEPGTSASRTLRVNQAALHPVLRKGRS